MKSNYRNQSFFTSPYPPFIRGNRVHKLDLTNIRLCIGLFIFLPVLALQAGDIKTDTEKIIYETVGDSMNLQFQKHDLDETLRRSIEKNINQKFFGDYVYVWNISLNDSIRAIAILDNVYGKSLPITFLTIFHMDGMLQKAAVIRYREPYGSGVSSSRWLNQFLGINANDDISIGNEIDAISGATISSRSMTLGIKKLTLLVSHLIKQKSLMNSVNESLTDNSGK